MAGRTSVMPSEQRERRSPLGLGPLETAIMHVAWEADTWLTVRDIRDRMDYPPVAYTTVAKVVSILYGKDLLVRQLGDRLGKPGPAAWWYRAARPMSEDIGRLIVTLLDYSPDPDASLEYTRAARRTRPGTPPVTARSARPVTARSARPVTARPARPVTARPARPVTPRSAPPVTARSAPVDEVVRLYRLGLTMTEIAGVYGVSAWTIASRLDEAGVARRHAKDRAAVLTVDRAVRRYRRQPHRLGELAAEMGISAQLILDRAAQPERGRRGQPRDRADVRTGEVADLYRAGWTAAQIAARYHTAASTVLRRLDEAGVARRPKSTPVPFPVEEAGRRLQQDGTTLAQLARDYHVGVSAVRGQLRARGILAPPLAGPRVLRGVPPGEIAGWYAAGLTTAQIGARYGVSGDTVRARLRAAGVRLRRVPPPLTTKPVPMSEAAARYRQGATLAELAASYAVTRQTIRRKLTASGVTLRSPRPGRPGHGPGRIPIPVEEAAQLYRSGQTLRQVAGRYGVCETVIYNRLTEAGVSLRRKTDRKQVGPALLARLAQQVGLDAAP
jgi:uncharacterized protein (DUF433 family)